MASPNISSVGSTSFFLLPPPPPPPPELLEPPPEDDSVIVKIKDNGIGFKPENKDAIFNQFTNVRNRGTLGESTTGIDLFIAKKIIDKHSGSIEANSEGEGKGAEFIVKLPD